MQVSHNPPCGVVREEHQPPPKPPERIRTAGLSRYVAVSRALRHVGSGGREKTAAKALTGSAVR